MTANRNIAVGAFVLGGCVLGVTAIVLFGQLHLFRTTLRAAVIFQDSVSGLSIGSAVTFRGVRVGAVADIAIQFNPATHIATIPVTVTIQPDAARLAKTTGTEPVDLQSLIALGLRAELNTQSFVTGQSEIDLDFDPGSAAVLHPDVTKLLEIPTRLSSMQRAKEQISQLPLRELADNANATLRSLRVLSEKLDHDLPPLVASLTATSDTSTATVKVATETIRDLQARLDATLGDFSRLAVTGERQISQRGTELHSLLATTNQTASQARDLIRNLQALTSERGDARVNVEAALRDLATAAASLRGFANDVEHNPQLLLTGRRP
jgi:paraquat-inducible protein B